MNTQIFTYSISRSAGGVCDAVRDLFTNTTFNGHRLDVMSFEDEYSEEDKGKWGDINIELFKAGPMLSSAKAKKALLEADADLLHMEGLWRTPHRWMADWKRQRKEPIVCSPHGMLDPYIIKSQGRIKRIISDLFFQKGLEAVDCYHALCKKELDDIRTYGLKQPVAIIPNGINLPDKSHIYERNDGKKHLLYLGRLHKKKGVDLLIQAIAVMKKEESALLRNWHIDLVGWDHENCKVELERLVSEEHLEDIVTFHGGLFGDDKTRMYATSDAYILPSHGEGLPMTVLEAWSWNLPVVMTPHCNLPEGFEADAAINVEDNVESVANGLKRLFHMSEEERKTMGQRGFQLVADKFTWDASAQKMIALYNWLLGKSDKPTFVYE